MSSQSYTCLCKIFSLPEGASAETVPLMQMHDSVYLSNAAGWDLRPVHCLDWPHCEVRTGQVVRHALPAVQALLSGPRHCRWLCPRGVLTATLLRFIACTPFQAFFFFYFENSKCLIEDSMYNMTKPVAPKFSCF